MSGDQRHPGYMLNKYGYQLQHNAPYRGGHRSLQLSIGIAEIDEPAEQIVSTCLISGSSSIDLPPTRPIDACVQVPGCPSRPRETRTNFYF